jgi:hypothetical protein
VGCYAGSTVAVYGAFNASAGVLSASFSVDGSSPSTVTFLNRTSTSSLPEEWTLHQALFEHTFPDTDAKAEHVLNVTVVEASEAQVRFPPFLYLYRSIISN